MSKPTFRRTHPGSYPPTYEVFYDGEFVGMVRYRETRYNLTRMYVTREWIATAGDVNHGSFNTRRDAAAALTPRTTPR